MNASGLHVEPRDKAESRFLSTALEALQNAQIEEVPLDIIADEVLTESKVEAANC